MLFLAYKGFKNFLEGSPTWEDYKRKVIDPYPALWNFHLVFGVMMGGMEKIKRLVSAISPQRYLDVFNRVKEERLCEIYDSVMAGCSGVLRPMEEVDVYFVLSQFMPVSMSVPASGKMNVVLSVAYDMQQIPLVLSHEYAHCVFVPRMTEQGEVQKFTDELSKERFEQLIWQLWFNRPLKWGMVNEGFASFFPRLVSSECSVYDALWMMPKEAVDWCMKNERQLKDNISKNLEERGMEVMRKYLLAGSLSRPPEGFPEQTAYYVGYRVVESCLEKTSLERLFSLGIGGIISTSRYFR